MKKKNYNLVLSEEEKLARFRLFRTESIGSRIFWHLILKYGSAEKAIKILEHSDNYKICNKSQVIAEIEKTLKFGANIVFYDDELYPPLLKKIDDASPFLVFLGDENRLKEFNNKIIIAIVGARNSSVIANKFCQQLVEELGYNDIVIISGLAKGIDANAHKTSLTTGTIAVQASGIDVVYPRENISLYEDIKNKGIIFTEMPFGTSPQANLFPKRNRIIAGIASGTVVIEAAKQSGSLITAKYALEYNRDVFAVPGFPTDIRSEGGNNLIKEGAIMVLSANDILEQFNYKQEKLLFNNNSINKQINLNEIDNIRTEILNHLSNVPITIDELISYVKLPPQRILTALMELELSNRVIRLHGQRICLA